MKLISMTDFVLEQDKLLGDYEDFRAVIVSYTKFLKQPLELWMFVPCKLVDGVWVVLEEPDDAKDYIFRGDSMRHEDLQEYQQAKERCLFEGNFTTKTHGENNVIYLNDSSFYTSWNKSKTIEDLIFLYLSLTQTAQKQIGCDH